MASDIEGTYFSIPDTNTSFRTSRRRASSNYFELKDPINNEANNNSKYPDDLKRSIQLFSSFDKLNHKNYTLHKLNHINSNETKRSELGLTFIREENEGIFEFLQSKFGFQNSSVLNQKEHLTMLLANKQSHIMDFNVTPELKLRLSIDELSGEIFENYIKWCEFLDTEPIFPGGENKKTLQLALYFLIWGESANLRFMPECLCFLYHKLAYRLLLPSFTDKINNMSSITNSTKNIESNSTNGFLNKIVKPIYKLLEDMKNSGNNNTKSKSLVRNYDDINEFFWNKKCLKFDEFTVAEAINNQAIKKTFEEKRSIFNTFLAFYRIYFFLFIMLHVLIAIAYVAYMGTPTSENGFGFYKNFWIKANSNLRKRTLYSIIVSLSALSIIKSLLELWLIGDVLFTASNVYALSLFVRSIWHSIGFGTFLCVCLSPLEKTVFGKTYLDIAPYLAVIYLTPIVISSISNMFLNKQIKRSFLRQILRESNNLFVGACTTQPFNIYSKYCAFWIILFIAKFLFNLQLMIVPLIPPTVELFNMNINDSTTRVGFLESNNNIAFIIALWAPVILVYLYDTQIWYTILTGLVGMLEGWKKKIGSISRVSQFSRVLEKAPSLFNQKIVSWYARGIIGKHTDGKNINTEDETNCKLRFAVVWNECVSSFRLSDLIDDREGIILLYIITDDGNVEDPVFLQAGKIADMFEMITKNSNKSITVKEFYNVLKKKNMLHCLISSVNLIIYLLGRILGKQEEKTMSVFLSLRDIFQNAVETNDKLIDEIIDIQSLPIILEHLTLFIESVLNISFPYDVSFIRTDGDNVINDIKINHDDALTVTQRLATFFKSVEMALKEKQLVEKLQASIFAYTTSDLQYQKNQLRLILSDINNRQWSRINGRAQDILATSILNKFTRMFLLLTLDAADALPRCSEAQRRLSFFLHSLSMDIPQIPSIYSMSSFSVVTPYYNETVLYSIDELNAPVVNNAYFNEKDDRQLTILRYLITCHEDEWNNFLERVNMRNMEEALNLVPNEVRFWSSNRGQTLARTVQGMMLYEDAIRMLRWIEIGSDSTTTYEEKERSMHNLTSMKFSYVTSCQLYSKQMKNNDVRASDIDLLMKRFPNWRVAFIDERQTHENNAEMAYDAVLIKSEGNEIVEVYRYEIPGNPIVGEGKPENQNIAMQFTRGEYVQTIDMNQEHYFEETLKMPNFLASAADGSIILGMKEHIFTGKVSSLARFMTLQELVFVNISQRVLADPLCARMHYGHPDVFNKMFVMTNGSVSKASRGINLSEDVFAGYSFTLRGCKISHHEFMICGKGRDVALSQINAFEAKLSNGSAEASLTRESHRMGSKLDFFRLHSIYYGHMGFYICNLLVVFCVYVYAYSKFYIGIDYQVTLAAISSTGSLDNLAYVINTQFIFQFGMLMTLPLLITLITETGILQTIPSFLELIVTLGPVFYIFETGTKAHYLDVAFMRGGSKYRGTGRGFNITRELFVNLYREYASSHYRKAIELSAIMVLFGIYGKFDIGKGVREAYCKSNDCSNTATIPASIKLLDSYYHKGQDYGIASFAVWLLAGTWILAPFLFNTDGFEFTKTRADICHWWSWMFSTSFSSSSGVFLSMASPGNSPMTFLDSADRAGSNQSNKKSQGNIESWLTWWMSEAASFSYTSLMGRIGYLIRESRHFIVMYYILIQKFPETMSSFLYLIIIAIVLLTLITALGFVIRRKGNHQRESSARRIFYGILYFAVVVLGLLIACIVIGVIMGWTVMKSVSLYIAVNAGLYGVYKCLLMLHGFCGIHFSKFMLVRELGFMFDVLFGFVMLLILFVLSAVPFMNTLQTRLMYNGGFSRALGGGGEFAALIATLVGALGGFSHGWYSCLILSLGNLNNSNDDNRSFRYFVEQVLHLNTTDFKKEYIPFYAACASIIGIMASTIVSRCFGRRASIVSGAILTYAGIACVFIENIVVIVIGICLMSFGISIVSFSIVQYNYEICMFDWKGRGVVIFMIGSAIGFVTESLILYSSNESIESKFFSNHPKNQWRTQFIYGAIPLIILFPICFGFLTSMKWLHIYESPMFYYEKRDKKAFEDSLACIRQKHDVTDEVEQYRTFYGASEVYWNRNSMIFRLLLASLLQITYAFASSGVLIPRIKNVVSPNQYYYGICILVGLLIGLLVVDQIRRKTILKDVLPFISTMSLVVSVLDICGISENIISKLLYLEFLAFGMSVASVTWLTVFDIFPMKSKHICIGICFAIFYGTYALLYYVVPGFYISHLITAFLCFVLSLLLFTIFASTKYGSIRPKSEKVREKLSRPDQDADGSLSDDSGDISQHPEMSSRARHNSFTRSRGQLRAVSGRGSLIAHINTDEGYEKYTTPSYSDKRILQHSSN